MSICLKQPLTVGAFHNVSYYVSTPPGTPRLTTSSNETKITCHCGQPTCPDYKAAA